MFSNRSFRSLKISVLSLLCLVAFSPAQQRYKDHCFSSVEVNNDITYRIIAANDTTADTLAFDLYVPEGDLETNRPLIIFMHGGSFVTGSRKDDYVQNYCEDMAKRGYVVASLSYRLGKEIEILLGISSFEEMAYMAVQDSRTAVRFFRANAATFGIDTSMIICGGYSAGAITALQHAYLNEQSLSPSLTAKHGGLESGAFTEYSSRINAVINYCGALSDTAVLYNDDIPVISIHGTADSIVPYKFGHAMNNSLMPVLYGSGSIHPILESKGVENILITAEGEGHEISAETMFSSMQQTASYVSSLYKRATFVCNRAIAGSTNGFNRMNRKKMLISRHMLGNKISSRVYDLKGRVVSAPRRDNFKAAGMYLIHDSDLR